MMKDQTQGNFLSGREQPKNEGQHCGCPAIKRARRFCLQRFGYTSAKVEKAMQLTRFKAASMTYLSDSAGAVRFSQAAVSELT